MDHCSFTGIRIPSRWAPDVVLESVGARVEDASTLPTEKVGLLGRTCPRCSLGNVESEGEWWTVYPVRLTDRCVARRSDEQIWMNVECVCVCVCVCICVCVPRRSPARSSVVLTAVKRTRGSCLPVDA